MKKTLLNSTGDTVRVRPTGYDKHWQRAKVTQQSGIRRSNIPYIPFDSDFDITPDQIQQPPVMIQCQIPRPVRSSYPRRIRQPTNYYSDMNSLKRERMSLKKNI